MTLTYYLYEDDPPQENEKGGLVWKQGYFSFGTQERIANITAIKFITKDIIVVAHRAVAKLYLIRIEDDFCEIIHSLELKKNNKFYHPDGMDLHEGKLYITTFTSECPIVEILDNTELRFKSVLEVKKTWMPYHGIYIGTEGFFFGGCAPVNKNETCIDYIKTNKTMRFNTGYNRRIKGIDMLDKNRMLVGSDDKRKGFREIFNSYIHSYKIDYKNQKLTAIDDIKLKDSQIDGIKLSASKKKWFATVHDATDKCGYIIIGSIIHSLELAVLSKFRCDNFPHGLDIHNGFIGFTCYGSSSFSIGREKELEGAEAEEVLI